MNWTGQYLQTKYLNLASHIISSRPQRYEFFTYICTDKPIYIAMAAKIDSRTMWNEGAEYGMILGLATGVFIFLNMGTAALA